MKDFLTSAKELHSHRENIIDTYNKNSLKQDTEDNPKTDDFNDSTDDGKKQYLFRIFYLQGFSYILGLLS